MSESNRPGATLDPVSQERMDAISELVRRVSHDYNNLFGIVIAALGILKDDIDEHPGIAQLKPLISDALSASKEGTELMERLLACTGYHLLQPEPVDLGRALSGLKERFERVLPGDIALQVVAEPDLPPAYVDPEAFTSTIDALVENAGEAMPTGGRLRISAERYDPSSAGGDMPGGSLPDGHYLSVSVTDSGAGIDSVLLRRVLEPFFTTKEPAKTRGFGLSRSYGFARQSRGALYLHSTAGNGTTVILVIPVAPETSG